MRSVVCQYLPWPRSLHNWRGAAGVSASCKRSSRAKNRTWNMLSSHRGRERVRNCGPAGNCGAIFRWEYWPCCLTLSRVSLQSSSGSVGNNAHGLFPRKDCLGKEGRNKLLSLFFLVVLCSLCVRSATSLLFHSLPLSFVAPARRPYPLTQRA